MSAIEPLRPPDEASPFRPDEVELESSLVARFRAQVEAHHDRLAVHDEFGHMTYGELAAASALRPQSESSLCVPLYLWDLFPKIILTSPGAPIQ